MIPHDSWPKNQIIGNRSNIVTISIKTLKMVYNKKSFKKVQSHLSCRNSTVKKKTKTDSYKLGKIWANVSELFFFFFNLIFFAYTGSWWQHVGSSSLTRVEPRPLHWEHRVLATGLPGKSPRIISNLSAHCVPQLYT